MLISHREDLRRVEAHSSDYLNPRIHIFSKIKMCSETYNMVNVFLINRVNIFSFFIIPPGNLWKGLFLTSNKSCLNCRNFH